MPPSRDYISTPRWKEMPGALLAEADNTIALIVLGGGTLDNKVDFREVYRSKGILHEVDSIVGRRILFLIFNRCVSSRHGGKEGDIGF